MERAGNREDTGRRAGTVCHTLSGCDAQAPTLCTPSLCPGFCEKTNWLTPKALTCLLATITTGRSGSLSSSFCSSCRAQGSLSRSVESTMNTSTSTSLTNSFQ